MKTTGKEDRSNLQDQDESSLLILAGRVNKSNSDHARDRERTKGVANQFSHRATRPTTLPGNRDRRRLPADSASYGSYEAKLGIDDPCSTTKRELPVLRYQVSLTEQGSVIHRAGDHVKPAASPYTKILMENDANG